MTAQDMITALRYRLDDTVGADANKMWTDGELLSYIDEVQTEVAEECRVLHVTSTVACEIGDSTFDAGGMTLEVEEAVLIAGTQRVPLGQSSMHEFVAAGVWPSPEVGTPTSMAPSDSSGGYVLDKELDFAASLYLITTSLPDPIIDDTSAIGIPAKYHSRMLNGVLKLCFLKPDKETFSQTKADLFTKMYEMDKEHIKRIESKVRPKAIKYVVG